MSLSPNLRGAGLMTLAMAGYTLNDACVKALGAEMPLFQILLLRGLGVTLALGLLVLALRPGRAGLGRREWAIVALRTLAETAVAWLFVSALLAMPIANISAILQALPLAVTLAGALVLGERVSAARLLAILAGLGGVLLIVRPGAEGFGWPALYALAAMLCMTVRDILARMLPRETPSLLVAAVTAAGVTAFAGAGSAFVDWVPLGIGAEALLLAAMGALMLGYVASVSAMRVGELSFVSPFRYASLIFSILLGAALFGTMPDAMTALGAAVVVASGTVTLLGERGRRRQGPARA